MQPASLSLVVTAALLSALPPTYPWPSRVPHHVVAHGVVVQRKEGCDYFIVETPGGKAVLEWFRGNDPDEGDELVGTFERYGFHDIYNATAKAELRVWVEDYWLGDEAALEKLYEHCD
jgi:hypothetical protein